MHVYDEYDNEEIVLLHFQAKRLVVRGKDEFSKVQDNKDRRTSYEHVSYVEERHDMIDDGRSGQNMISKEIIKIEVIIGKASSTPQGSMNLQR